LSIRAAAGQNLYSRVQGAGKAAILHCATTATGNTAPIKPASTIGFPPISLFAENFPHKTQGLGCDLLRIALLDTQRLPMKKEAYDESNIDPVDRCAGNNQRGLFKH